LLKKNHHHHHHHHQSINQSSGICTIGQMGKRLWLQYKDLIDTQGLETKIPRDSGPTQTDKKNRNITIYITTPQRPGTGDSSR
jgi:hypothetical protein